MNGSNTVGAGVVDAVLARDGSAMVYQTVDGALRRIASAPRSEPVTLALPGVFGRILKVSSAFDQALIAGPNPSAPPVLSRISLLNPTSADTIVRYPGYAGFDAGARNIADAFTEDGSRALFFANSDKSVVGADLMQWTAAATPSLVAPRTTFALAFGRANLWIEQQNATDKTLVDESLVDFK
jgi:hypothetical protein